MARILSRDEAAGLKGDLYWPKGTDPVTFASKLLGQRLYKWQVDVIRDCQKQGNQVAVVTPNESGKTSMVIPTLGLSFMAAFAGSQVVSTAGVERQIKRNLWPVLHSTLSPYPRWKITDDELKITAPSVRGLLGSEWIAFTTKDPEYAEGFHSRWYKDENGKLTYGPLLIIIDEAKSFENPDLIFALTHRCDPDILLMISTPGSDQGPFYDAFHTERNKPWICHEVGWEDCPHLRTGVKLLKRQREIERFGENNSRVLSWIFGKFYRAVSRVVFDNWPDVEMAMSGTIPTTKGQRRAAVDFSGGGDEQVFAWSEGTEIKPFEIFHERDDMKLADILCALFRRHGLKSEDITADNGGAGKTCIDILAAKGFTGIRRYMSNDDARDKNLFKYRITEDHYHLRHLVRYQSVQLPDDPVLKEQMRKRRYLILNDENLMQVEPKEKMRNRGENSPDRLDTIVMLCSDMPTVTPRDLGIRPDRGNICGDPKDCFKEPEENATSVFADD